MPGRRPDRRGARLLRRLDLQGYGDAPGNDGTDAGRDRLGNQEHMSRLILRLRDTPQPIIAAVNGPAAGFGWRSRWAATSATRRESAVFRAAFINIGVSNCDMAASWLLPRLIGASRAHELMLTGRRVDAEEADAHRARGRHVDDERLLDARARGRRQIAALRSVGRRA